LQVPPRPAGVRHGELNQPREVCTAIGCLVHGVEKNEGSRRAGWTRVVSRSRTRLVSAVRLCHLSVHGADVRDQLKVPGAAPFPVQRAIGAPLALLEELQPQVALFWRWWNRAQSHWL